LHLKRREQEINCHSRSIRRAPRANARSPFYEGRNPTQPPLSRWLALAKAAIGRPLRSRRLLEE